jgi:hypothetical protein
MKVFCGCGSCARQASIEARKTTGRKTAKYLFMTERSKCSLPNQPFAQSSALKECDDNKPRLIPVDSGPEQSSASPSPCRRYRGSRTCPLPCHARRNFRQRGGTSGISLAWFSPMLCSYGEIRCASSYLLDFFLTKGNATFSSPKRGIYPPFLETSASRV